MRPGKRMWARTGGALGLVLLLGGCISVPTSGPVKLGEPVADGGDGSGVVSIPRSPKEGSTPTDIVTGFLLANASSANDYSIARSYLAPEISEGWNPNAGAVVYDDATGLNLTERGATVSFSEPQNGTMTSAGSYQPSPAGSRLSTDFTLRKVDGQWRIVGVRDGLLLSVRDVESVYQGVDRFYFNERRTALVPDRVLVPGDRAGVQTTLVRGLLQGASAWLAPAVATAFPSGTALAIDSVPLVDGVATVDLTREVLGADDAARRLLSAQLVWTLTSLGTVSGVRITVSGQPLSVPGVGDVMTRNDFAGVDPNVIPLGTPGYVVVGKKLTVLSSEPPPAVPGVFGDGSVSTSRVAVNLDTTVAAVTVSSRGASGTVFTGALRAGSSPSARTTTTAVGSLSYTVGGSLWIVDSSSGQVKVLAPRGAVQNVPTEGSGRVVALRMSRDGARAALVVRAANGSTSLFLARVVQGTGGLQVQAPRLVENQVADVADVAWVDADTLVVIGRTAVETRQAHEVVVGDVGVTALGRVQGMTRVAAAPGSPLLLAGAGGVWENAGTGWRLAVAGARAPAYPG